MAASTFERALSLVLKHEGGFVNDPRDPGGATNLGVTIGTARRLGIDVDGDGDTDIVDIKLLRVSDAAKVYRAEFWNNVGGDTLPAGLDYALFDFAVNSGPSRAIIGLQRVLGVADDGKLGPITLAAIQARTAKTLIGSLCDGRLAFLRALSTWPTYGKGWTRRVEEVRTMALAMAAASIPLSSPPHVDTAGPLTPMAPNAARPPMPITPVPSTPTVTTGGLWATLKSLFAKKAA